ncbi:beta/gamma crystallin domain-containing protein [Thermocatellispora tengchongensis]
MVLPAIGAHVIGRVRGQEECPWSQSRNNPLREFTYILTQQDGRGSLICLANAGSTATRIQGVVGISAGGNSVTVWYRRTRTGPEESRYLPAGTYHAVRDREGAGWYEITRIQIHRSRCEGTRPWDDCLCDKPCATFRYV